MSDHAVDPPFAGSRSAENLVFNSSKLSAELMHDLETLSPNVKQRIEVFKFMQMLVEEENVDVMEKRPPNVRQCFSDTDNSGYLFCQVNVNFSLLMLLVVREHADVMETLSPNVRQCIVEVIKYLKNEYDKLETKFLEERAQLEAKYLKLYEPLYIKRYEIVNGVIDVEGITNEAALGEEDKASEEKGVPSFWLTAMKTNETLGEEITEHDEEALKYLKDIKWCKLDNPYGFKLEFYFDSNPYFQNSVLTKTYHILKDNDPIVEKSTGTEIMWHPGKCLAQKVLKKKPKKGSKNSKLIIKTVKRESFFNIFNTPQIPEDDDNIDDDVVEELQNLMQHDYEIGYVTSEYLRVMIYLIPLIRVVKPLVLQSEKKLFLMLCHGSREKLYGVDEHGEGKIKSKVW
ncbi:hypothetical protein TSUD_376110 [Trifolium subterraneum]|uniref:Nucleosome assembly protein n=1 Tax=Trifolium subterraneum TaxID=3900 RepID=A0A2Z6MKV7_TRISU|nr:hypothetical protein TSUD_376110 [Trifolium subterraneum]